MQPILMMVIGYTPVLLLIFLQPAMALGIFWELAIVIVTMMLCHLMHFGMHDHEKNGANGREHLH